MSEEFTIEPVSVCDLCGSGNIQIRIIPSCGMARFVCLECGNSKAIQHTENKSKRVNGQLLKWAADVKRRDGYACVVCGSRQEVEAHHIIPVKNDPEQKYKVCVTNGVTLCKNCHRMAHGGRGNGAPEPKL